MNSAPIEYSKSKYHFRYVKSLQIVDLTSDNGIDFKGSLINRIIEVTPTKNKNKKNNKPNKYIYEIIELNKNNASKIGQLIINDKLYLIQTDTLINNWNFNWLDCGSIDLYFKNEDIKHHVHYTCPWKQNDTINKVKEVKKTYQAFEKILNLKQKYSEFKNKLEKGKNYHLDFRIMYIMTEKESKEWKKNKPIREYKKSISDTISKFLEKKINKLIPNSKTLNCYDDFQLTFSKKGKLIKITSNETSFWERTFDKNYRKCRKIVKKAFMEIKIDFIDPKYQFYRTLSFGQNRINIYDREIY